MSGGYSIVERIVRIVIVLVVVFLILAILVGLVASQNSKVLTDSRFLGRLVEQALIYAVVAAGMSLVLAAGEADLSVGGVASLAAIVMAGLMLNYDMPAVIALALVLGLGLLVGLLNGVLIAGLRLPFYIVTSATWGLTLGIGFILTNARPLLMRGQAFEGSLALLLLNLIVYGLGVLVLLLLGRFTSLGKLISLNARSEAEGRPGGLVLGLYKIGAYTVSGLLAAAAGVAMLNLVRMTSPTSYYDLALMAIAAAVIGGVPLWKGSTRLLGVFWGGAALVLANYVAVDIRGGDVTFPNSLAWATLALPMVILWGIAGWVLDLVFGRRKPVPPSDNTSSTE